MVASRMAFCSKSVAFLSLRMSSNKQAVIERKPEADPKTTNVKEDAVHFIVLHSVRGGWRVSLRKVVSLSGKH